MSDNFIVNDGDQAKLVPVTLKDHSKDPMITELVKEMEKQTGVPAELVAPVVEKKKRGRPKKAAAIREFYCSTCREVHTELAVMKMPAGDGGRAAIFCPNCQKMLTFLQPDLDSKVEKLIKNNPTK